MTWADLLFVHWRADPAALRRLIPAPLELDTFEGEAFVGLVPFRMADCSFRGFSWLPAAAGLRDFFECNVRTYVRLGDLRGVWFLSLDAQTLLPVLGGRWLWSLNYIHSRFEVRHESGKIDYRLARRSGPWPKASTRVSWHFGTPRPPSRPGDLDHFLTERYLLFTRRFGRIAAGRVAHDPWPLHDAELLDLDDGLVRVGGVAPRGDPIVYASQRIVVDGFSLRPAP
jgi:uncharacterized protein YqjF (DUF2071 family)